MNKVKVLDAHLTNMIAAGEVVERPSGIVKELVENAIDAQATTIEVHFDEGGMSRIEVIDNGEGMTEHDLIQAFERHSTSKISTTQDLNHILSFGFRGEALPSIASVSHVEATTSQNGTSYKLVVDNGSKSEIERTARNQGTTIRVQNLFAKTPARLKYIKNVRYEASIIMDIMQKFALARPDIAFSVYNEGALKFRTYGKGTLEDVFYRVHGLAIAQDSRAFETNNYDFKIHGMMALPQHNRANKYGIWLYINNRMIRYTKAQNAVVDAFRRYMPVDRYPIVALHIEVDPQLVDVNVHPSKWEIRLSKEEQLIELIISHLEGMLEDQMRPQRVSFKPTSDIPEQESFDPIIQEALFKPESIASREEPKLPFRIQEEAHEDSLDSIQERIHETRQERDPIAAEMPQNQQTASEQPKIEPLKVLSQMSGKYILAQGEKGLYIVDQHAAMERVRYEYFQDKVLNREVVLQDLLIPIIVENHKPLMSRLEEINQAFEPLNIHVEAFGEEDFIVRSVPLWIKNDEVFEFITTVFDMFEANKTIRVEDIRRNMIATLACHSSVRFNEYMSMEAMQTLLQQLRDCKQPFHCPHGRPTFITVEHDQLIKEFKR